MLSQPKENLTPLTLEGNAEEVEMFLDLIKKYYTYH